MKYLLLFTILSPFVLFSQSENLVPNPSFELYKELPNDIGQGKKCLVDWTIPNASGTGDYYHMDSATKKAGTKKNYFGKQAPRTGKAYMGLCITNRFREFLQVKLRSNLIKDKQYKIVVFISCADKAKLGIVDEFNMLFSTSPFKIPNNEDLLVVPEIKFTGDFTNKKEWIELTAIYEATGKEEYLTFGTFMYEENGIKHGQIQGVSKYAHYYIDDLSITRVDNTEEIALQKTEEEKPLKDSIISYDAGKTYVFDKLLFESGESVLLANNYPEIDELIQFLASNPQLKLLITGHTDNIGNEIANKKLSYDRAKAVKLYLIKKGIKESAISIEGKGDSIPLMSNDTAEGRKVNRRVEISILE